MADQMKSVLTERLRAVWPKETMSAESKRTKLMELDQQILAAERAEEKIILDIEKIGGRVLRRADLDPRVFLQITEDLNPLV